jgi:hypothetical protein
MTSELTDAQKTDRVRALNDMARQKPGVACRANMTIGFAALEEHDFGAIYRLHTGEWTQHRPKDHKMIGETVFWKIDCYDKQLEFGSEAPWDSAQTARVLTIMLANEY